MFFRKKGDRNYQKSNRYTAVAFDLNKEVCRLAEKIMKSKSATKRQSLSDELCDALNDLAEIDICTVKVSDTKQYHKRSGGRVVMKQYGYYKPKQKYIYIQNRTAVRGQILAPKTFLNTLLHEWMHHYDHCALGLNSVHTSGFYQRLGNLQRGLLGEG